MKTLCARCMAALLLLSGTAYGIETSSYRIKALGDEAVTGIIADEYTDVNLNPARAGRIRASSLGAKVGLDADPLGLYYLAPGWAVTGEGSTDRREQAATNFDLNSNYPLMDIRRLVQRQQLLDENVSFAVTKAVPFGSGSFGIALLPSFQDSLTRRVMTDRIETSDTRLREYQDQSSDEEQRQQTAGGEVKLGFYRASGDREQDIVLSARYDGFDSASRYFYSRFTDNDVDGDGVDAHGNVIATPNTRSDVSRKISTGASGKQTYRLEHWVRTKLNAAESSTFGLGLAYAPDRYRETEELTASESNIAGATISSGTTTAVKRAAVDEKTVSGWVKYGRSIALRDNLLFGAGVRATAVYDAIEQKTDASFSSAVSETGAATTVTLLAGAGIEYTPRPYAAVRFSVAPSISKTVSTGDAINILTDGKQFTNAETSAQQVTYAFGLGLAPFESLGIDLLTYGNIVTPAQYQLQVRYLFR